MATAPITSLTKAQILEERRLRRLEEIRLQEANVQQDIERDWEAKGDIRKQIAEEEALNDPTDPYSDQVRPGKAPFDVVTPDGPEWVSSNIPLPMEMKGKGHADLQKFGHEGPDQKPVISDRYGLNIEGKKLDFAGRDLQNRVRQLIDLDNAPPSRKIDNEDRDAPGTNPQSQKAAQLDFEKIRSKVVEAMYAQGVDSGQAPLKVEMLLGTKFGKELINRVTLDFIGNGITLADPDEYTNTRYLKDMKTQAEVNFASTANDLGWSLAMANGNEEEMLKLDAATEEYARQNKVLQRGRAADVMQNVSGMLPALTMGTGAGLLGAGAGSIVGPGGTAAGFKMGSTAFWSAQGSGMIYRELYKLGVDPKIAKTFALVGGAGYGAVESLQFGQFTGTFRNYLISGRFRSFVKSYIENVGTEALEEGAQNIVTDLAEKFAADLNNHVKGTEFETKDIGTILVDGVKTAANSVPEMAVLSGTGGVRALKAGHRVNQIRAQERAVAEQEMPRRPGESLDQYSKRVDHEVTRVITEMVDKPEEVKTRREAQSGAQQVALATMLGKSEAEGNRQVSEDIEQGGDLTVSKTEARWRRWERLQRQRAGTQETERINKNRQERGMLPPTAMEREKFRKHQAELPGEYIPGPALDSMGEEELRSLYDARTPGKPEKWEAQVFRRLQETYPEDSAHGKAITPWDFFPPNARPKNPFGFKLTPRPAKGERFTIANPIDAQEFVAFDPDTNKDRPKDGTFRVKAPADQESILWLVDQNKDKLDLDRVMDSLAEATEELPPYNSTLVVAIEIGDKTKEPIRATLGVFRADDGYTLIFGVRGQNVGQQFRIDNFDYQNPGDLQRAANTFQRLVQYANAREYKDYAPPPNIHVPRPPARKHPTTGAEVGRFMGEDTSITTDYDEAVKDGYTHDPEVIARIDVSKDPFNRQNHEVPTGTVREVLLKSIWKAGALGFPVNKAIKLLARLSQVQQPHAKGWAGLHTSRTGQPLHTVAVNTMYYGVPSNGSVEILIHELAHAIDHRMQLDPNSAHAKNYDDVWLTEKVNNMRRAKGTAAKEVLALWNKLDSTPKDQMTPDEWRFYDEFAYPYGTDPAHQVSESEKDKQYYGAELFAQSVMMYFTHPAILKRLAPITYKAVEESIDEFDSRDNWKSATGNQRVRGPLRNNQHRGLSNVQDERGTPAGGGRTQERDSGPGPERSRASGVRGNASGTGSQPLLISEARRHEAVARLLKMATGQSVLQQSAAQPLLRVVGMYHYERGKTDVNSFYSALVADLPALKGIPMPKRVKLLEAAKHEVALGIARSMGDRTVTQRAEILKMLDSETPEQLLDTYWAERDLAYKLIDKRIRQLSEEVQSLVGEDKYGPKSRELDTAIHLWIDAKHAAGKDHDPYTDVDWSGFSEDKKRLIERSRNLSPDELKLAEKVRRINAAIGRRAVKDNVLAFAYEDYTKRIWNFGQRSPLAAIGNVFTRRHSGQKARTLPSIMAGWAEGYELRTESALQSQLVAAQEVTRAALNQKFLKVGQAWGWIQQQPRPGFVRSDALSGHALGYSVFVPYDIAKDVNATFSPSYFKQEALDNRQAFLQWSLLWNTLVKHSILSWSYFHHLAFSRSFVFGQSGPFLSGLNVRQAYKEGLQIAKELTPELKELVQAGLTYGLEARWDEMVGGSQTWIGEQFDKQVDKLGPLKSAKDAVRSLHRRHTEFLFNQFGTGLKVKAAIIEYRHLLKLNSRKPEAEQKSRHEIAKLAADIVNSDFGGMHYERLGISRTTWDALRLALLAPDWTISNMRTLYKAAKAGDRRPFIMFWVRAILRGQFLTQGANLILSFFDDEDYLERLKTAANKKWIRAFQADITPIYRAWRRAIGKDDNKGERFYFSIMGHFLDPIKWAGSPVDAAKHKGSIFYSWASDIMTGTDWKGDSFTTLDEWWNGGLLEQHRTTKWEFQAKDLDMARWPSFAMNQTISMLPIPAQTLMFGSMGEEDWFQAAPKMLGIDIGRERPRKPKARSKANLNAANADLGL